VVTVTATADGIGRVEAVYREDGDRLWRALLAYSGDADIASDAVAEAFAQALQRGTAIRDPQAWVWRAAFRIAAGELKRQSSTTYAVPEDGYFDTEVDAELVAALRRLPDKQRAAVVLFYYADAPIREIARRTGMTRISVRANLSRGRRRLRQLLGEHDG
jgi:RNA polymerase sigma-70 factor (ECF subfamily)